MPLALYSFFECLGVATQTSLPLLMAFTTDTNDTLFINILTGKRVQFADETNSTNYTIEAAGFKGSGAELTGIPISAVTNLQTELNQRKKVLARWSGTQTVGNTTTETSLIANAFQLPANTLSAGRVLWLRLFGYMSTLASSPGVSQLFVKVSGTVIAATISQTNTIGTTKRAWVLDMYIQCMSTTAVWSAGEFRVPINTNPTVVTTYPVCNPSAPGVQAEATVNASYDNTVDVTWKWATANASNSITCKGGVMVLL